jgi:3-hydroxyisobutyrate dehydrogenase-like beta-hydroxyacid dehydrogenase
MRIAFIGAGKMGLPVCNRLLAAGHDIKALARRPEQAKILGDHGFSTAGTVSDTIKGSDIAFTCVSDDKALADVTLDNAIIAPVFIDMSTVSPDISAKIAARLPKSVGYLRSPVSGSTALAETGTLTALVSGPKATFESMAHIYAAFTRKAFHLGEGEEARYLKLAINSMVAATAALLGEALAFGRKGGLSHEAMLDVFTQSAVASPLIGYKKDMIVSGNYKPAATLDMLKKDVELLLAAADEQKTPLPVNTLIRNIYQTASSNGLGEKDFFVLVREAERAAGLKPDG